MQVLVLSVPICGLFFLVLSARLALLITVSLIKVLGVNGGSIAIEADGL